MKGAIASVEIFAHDGSGTRRLTLTLAAPERDDDGMGWSCRVALADLHRPETIRARDSVQALAQALARATDWLDALRSERWRLTRDRAGREPFELA